MNTLFRKIKEKITCLHELITIVGPTASGKTSFAVHLADQLNTEIISADSRQVYCEMDIGTGKDIEKYHLGEKFIRYHLINICEPGEKYNVFRFQQDFNQIFISLKEQGKLPILCGGTGLYIESVLKGYHFTNVPENSTLRLKLKDKNITELKKLLQSYEISHNMVETNSTQRVIRLIEIAHYSSTNQFFYLKKYPPIHSLIIGIDMDRQYRREKISFRLKKRLKNGMIEEVKNLLDSGVVTDKELLYYGLEYKYITLYLTGKISYPEMYSQLESAIFQFAKRQMTWFKGMERRGLEIHWINAQSPHFSDEIF